MCILPVRGVHPRVGLIGYLAQVHSRQAELAAWHSAVPATVASVYLGVATTSPLQLNRRSIEALHMAALPNSEALLRDSINPGASCGLLTLLQSHDHISL